MPDRVGGFDNAAQRASRPLISHMVRGIQAGTLYAIITFLIGCMLGTGRRPANRTDAKRSCGGEPGNPGYDRGELFVCRWGCVKRLGVPRKVPSLR
jgi:hypothetical protein